MFHPRSIVKTAAGRKHLKECRINRKIEELSRTTIHSPETIKKVYDRMGDFEKTRSLVECAAKLNLDPLNVLDNLLMAQRQIELEYFNQ